MEIKATLLKPYTKVQKRDFILQQNRLLGYIIEETETALEAWGYTEEEYKEKQKQQTRAEITEKIKLLLEGLTMETFFGCKNNEQVYKDIIQGLIKTKNNL